MNSPPHLRLTTRFTVLIVMCTATGMIVMGGIMTFQLSMAWFYGAIGMTVLLAVLIGGRLVQSFLKPVSEIQEMARALIKRYSPPGEIMKGDDELVELAHSFNHLAARFQDRIQALESERAKMSAILDSMVEGVMALDAQGRILVTNPSARRILDLGQDRVEGHSLLEIIRNRKLSDLVEWCQTMNPIEPCRGEMELHSPNHRVLEVNAMPLPLSDHLNGTVLVLHDMTELRRLEQVRAEFVVNVSHELRTPLTAIKGYLETLLDESPIEPETHRRFLEVAHTHADRLGRLIDDLLNLSDIETGRVTLHPTVVDLRAFIQEVADMFKKDAVKKGVKLSNHVHETVLVKADRDRLSQILLNVIDNAVKYTPSGGQVTLEAKTTSEDQVVLQVHDTGQGIPSKDLPRITERFYRVDKARSREAGGTGLGLSIVKHLVQLHAGTLTIDSELGKGTTIEIALPVL